MPLTDKGFGNYKLPLILLVMLTPMVFYGPGKFSIDYLIRRKYLGKA